MSEGRPDGPLSCGYRERSALAAPSFEEAKARAELALRVHRGDFLDS